MLGAVGFSSDLRHWIQVLTDRHVGNLVSKGKVLETADKQTYTQKSLLLVQSNLSNTDTEGTEQGVRIREVSAV